MHYGDLILGKTTVLSVKILLRLLLTVLAYTRHLQTLFNLMDNLKLTIDEVDAPTGPIIGRPEISYFPYRRDVVVLIHWVKVAKGVAENCPADEQRAVSLFLHGDKWLPITGWVIKPGGAFAKRKAVIKAKIYAEPADIWYAPRQRPNLHQ